MKFSIRYADKIVGILVILGLTMVVFVIFMLAGNQRFFKDDKQFWTEFDSASGLGVNMPIQYRGFTIGHVKQISLNFNRVEVKFIIYEEYTGRVRVGSLVEVQESPIGLGSTFIFHPGLGDLLNEDDFIPVRDTPEARVYEYAKYTSTVGSTDNINAIMLEVRTLLENLNYPFPEGVERPPIVQILENIVDVTYEIADLTNFISEAIINPVMEEVSIIMEQIDDIINNHQIIRDIAEVTGRIAAPSSVVMEALDAEGDLYISLVSALSSFADIIETLNKTSETLPAQFPQIWPIIVQLQDILTAVENNPLLRRGIPERTETSPGGAGSRNLDF